MTTPAPHPTRPTPTPTTPDHLRTARRAAHLLALCTVPSGLWRLAMAAQLPVGYSAEVLRDVYAIPGWGVAYVVGLTVLQECAALLPLLLVTGRLRRPGPRTAVRAGRILAALLSLFCLSQAVLFFFVTPDGHLSPSGHTLFLLVYAPLLATGPLLWLTTRAYARQHRL
ncbi:MULTISPECIES: hypothetical protein [Streptomyces]|uniref:Integral membrane protein n=1 Tax=Streptomyces solicathayae TaxID=3081768 RepID=A0ABZ0LVR4_9ACTN|nr:hypothetical protein [Streptomyces sp. HUAS YS2]WOX23592.1 hypothetical protein R2D22_20280 [Streptomyces sp. HUAS YS2]